MGVERKDIKKEKGRGEKKEKGGNEKKRGGHRN